MLEVVSVLKSQEKAHRSVFKAVTMRLVSMLSDLTLTSFITGKAGETVQIILLTNLSSTILYFMHERIWNQIDWGRDVINPAKHKVRERHSRSLTKAITYRATAIFFDITIISLIVQNTPQTLAIVVLTNIGSTIVYIIHERIWNRIHWGKHVQSQF